MNEINISTRPEMSEEERIKELESEVDGLMEENSRLENEMSELIKRDASAEVLLEKAKKGLNAIQSEIDDVNREIL